MYTPVYSNFKQKTIDLRWSLKHDRDPLLTNAIRRGRSQALAELAEASSTRPDLEKTSWSRDLQVFSKLVESDFSVSGWGIYSVPPRTTGLRVEPKTAKNTDFTWFYVWKPFETPSNPVWINPRGFEMDFLPVNSGWVAVPAVSAPFCRSKSCKTVISN